MALSMKREIINKIYVNDKNEFVLSIEGQGDSFYQYIYREAAGVSWDPKDHGFKSTPSKQDWSCSKWFSHIVSLVHSSLSVELTLGNNVIWHNVPEQNKNEIEGRHAI